VLRSSQPATTMLANIYIAASFFLYTVKRADDEPCFAFERGLSSSSVPVFPLIVIGVPRSPLALPVGTVSETKEVENQKLTIEIEAVFCSSGGTGICGPCLARYYFFRRIESSPSASVLVLSEEACISNETTEPLRSRPRTRPGRARWW
jgi:hypothetical protein